MEIINKELIKIRIVFKWSKQSICGSLLSHCALHFLVSVRSFRSEATSKFIVYCAMCNSYFVIFLPYAEFEV